MVRKGGTALDIGANIGIFSYRLAGLAKRVVSFEINDDLLAELKAWNPGNIEVVPKGLSSEAHEATLYIPVLNGKKLVGWASLAPGNCPDTNEHVTKRVETVTLDSLALRGVTFIKMDVEGHELEVLRGAAETLKANQPVMMVEIRERNLAPVRELLGRLGYAETTMKALTGQEGSEGNYFFIPREKA
jgi:FkbM family methyltransferase